MNIKLCRIILRKLIARIKQTQLKKKMRGERIISENILVIRARFNDFPKYLQNNFINLDISFFFQNILIFTNILRISSANAFEIFLFF